MKTVIQITKNKIKIINTKIQTFDYCKESDDLIKEHLELTEIHKPKNGVSTYTVNGGPLAQTIEVLREHQAEAKKKPGKVQKELIPTPSTHKQVL